ncbi:tRNA (adenosine(37)-N6)-threonylcarbamoyltransferase complex dimerization subunit type 1 TsaB [Crocinitomix algicola]|uniref:tRNA (adenosine(37)-N6)-threonylcarbamoyltransferase complex dimerization subunit type 1 TsaB n=1 Tax=Crocinitomix algicola TaxID=1740263 RepID=UPI000871C62D|nr:tRNA (adenosine(37)-N6)-threonylcarbamoyltransferase complex dimerization subunit type 1 TsaB [Crocinitomix algicola]
MARILCIETATKVCSVCLAEDGVSIGSRWFESEKYSHAEKLNLLIQELFQELDLALSDIDAVAVSEGPGSYTGLRIGTSTAKGICYALDKPLIAINSLKSLAALSQIESGLVCPLFDARRMEVYAAVFSSNLDLLMETQPVIVDESSFKSFLAKEKVLFIGPGAEKCSDIIQHQNALFNIDLKVRAEGMTGLAHEAFQKKTFVNLAYFEPFYLKDFIAGTPKKIF